MSNNIKRAFISFLITFAILFPISTIVLVNIKMDTDEIKTQNVISNEYNIPKEQDLNIMLVIGDKDLYKKKTYSLIKVSPHDNTIAMASFDSSLITVVGNKTGNLDQHLISGGYKSVKSAIETLTETTIDRFIATDDYGAQEIINSLSAVEINLSCDVSYNNLKLKKGEQLLDGSRFVAVLHSLPNNALSSLSNCFNNFDLNSFFKTISKVCSTDFTAYDFEVYKGGFQQMIKNKNAELKIPKIETEKISDRNRLTEKSKLECLEVFKKE